MNWDVQVPFLTENVIRCVPLLGLSSSGLFFRLAGPCIARCPGGPTVFIAFWSKFCPVDFNRDLAACLIFLPCTTSTAIFNPVFKAWRPSVFAPFFSKGMAALIYNKESSKDTAKSMSSLI